MATSGDPSKRPVPGSISLSASDLNRSAQDRNSSPTGFQNHDTLDVRFSGRPSEGQQDLSEEHARAFLRAYTVGVTEEAKGRYQAHPGGELGRGAIGRVFLAEDSHLSRQIAIKELLESATDPNDDSKTLQTVSRFLREARVTGGLEHPSIVPVYELGRRADGTLYYTMRVARGRTLARAIAQARDLNERLALVNHFSGLCQAMAYAHSRGIVHRDIKPDNVMIGEFGETVILDWGMAKRCADENDEAVPESATPRLELESPELTLEGSVCGTPLYMSPEQASGRGREVDSRSDVWSLGVVLYTILSGRVPFSGQTLLEISRQVTLGRYTPLRVIDPHIPAELAAVVERALKPDRLERYPSARELSLDVQAYQAGMRVAAYEYSSFDLLRRFVARHRSAVTASALALVVVLILSFSAYRRVVAARDRALLAERRAIANELGATKSAEHARHSLGEALLERAEQALLEGDSVHAERLAARALSQEERREARGIVIAARSAPRPDLTATLAETKGCVHSALSFEAGLFACAIGHELTLYGIAQRTRLTTLPLASDALTLAFASDGSALATVLADGTVGVHAVTGEGSQPWHFERCGQRPTQVAVTSGGRHFACADARGTVTVWSDSAKNAQLIQLGQGVSALAFSKNGRQLGIGGELGALLLYDESQRTERKLAGHSGTVLALTMAAEGRYLASGGADRMLRFWDTTSGRESQSAIVHTDAITSLAWSDDRRVVAFGGRDGTMRVVDQRSGRVSLMRQRDQTTELVAVSANGNELGSYSAEVGLRLWSLNTSPAASELNERGNVLALGLGAGEDQLLSVGLGRNGACIWDLKAGVCSTRLPVRLDRVRALAVSQDRRQLALAGSGTQIFVWDLTQNIPTQVIDGLRDETRALSFSLDGQRLAAAGLDRKLRIFDVSSAAVLHEVETIAPIQTLSVAPDSGALFAGDQAGAISVWDLNTGRLSGGFQAHAGRVLGSAISRDGTLFASAGADQQILIWDVRTRHRRFKLVGHTGKVLSVDFSPDGSLLASGGEDKTVCVWDMRTGRALATLTGHSGIVRAVRFTERANVLASGGDDGVIRLWQLQDLRRPAAELEARVVRQFNLEPEEAENAGH